LPIFPDAGESDEELRAHLGLGSGPVLLCVGGIKGRKNTIRILQAFVAIHRAHPDARLVIAGAQACSIITPTRLLSVAN
jgi:hypothetical protein